MLLKIETGDVLVETFALDVYLGLCDRVCMVVCDIPAPFVVF